MGRETEIKLRIADVEAFLRALRRLGARQIRGEMGHVHEWNTVFDTPANDLKRRGQLLRIRSETPARSGTNGRMGKGSRVTLTFKRPIGGRNTKTRGGRRGEHKVREELELRVTDGDELTRIFEGLGMRAWFRYEKYRTTFRLPDGKRWAGGLLIELDETPIGVFAELEGPANAINRAAKELGFSKRDYIVANYFVLYREACRRKGVKPGDMLFANRR